jgi:hypothetical protein
MKGAVAIVASGVALVLLLAVGAVSSSAAADDGCLPSGVAVTGEIPESLGLDAEQRANAAAVVQAAVSRRLPTRAAVIAIATALQESSLRNLPFGASDSVGLFQQRPSAGWGRPAQLMDPAFAADLFLARLVKVPRWHVRPSSEVAQEVQKSGHPDAYARWETAATAIVASLLNRPSADAAPPDELSDLPGLAVFGDESLRELGTRLPPTYLNGPVSVDIQPGRTLGELRAELDAVASLPGTVVLSAGISPRHARDGRLRRQIRSVLDRVETDRTVFWVTHPDDPIAEALTQAASDGDRLVIVDSDGLLPELGLTDAPDPTSSAVPGCDDGLGGFGSVGVPDCSFSLPKANPRACQDAMRWALAQVDGPPVWHRRCLNFTARAYGYTVSGVESAALYWASAVDAHPNDENPPAGSLAFWDTGTDDGHVALSLGSGLVVSNDIEGRGTIAVVPLDELTGRWSARYLGWAPPFFPNGA